MAEWKNFNINTNQVETQTAKAVLIKMPNGSRYAGFKFWHPLRCVHGGRHSHALSIGYTDEFKFKLERRSPKTFEILATEVLDAEDLAAEFEVVNDNISAPNAKFDFTTVEVSEAPEVEANNVEIPKDLLND